MVIGNFELLTLNSTLGLGYSFGAARAILGGSPECRRGAVRGPERFARGMANLGLLLRRPPERCSPAPVVRLSIWDSIAHNQRLKIDSRICGSAPHDWQRPSVMPTTRQLAPPRSIRVCPHLWQRVVWPGSGP